MKIDQIAWYAHNEDQVREIKAKFGLLDKEWIEDIATGDVQVNRMDGSTILGSSTGHLRFNYDLGIELEILTYISGPHWHEDNADFVIGRSFLSHIGIHMGEGEVPFDTASRVVQRMTTTQHTNPYLLEKKRTYDYRIRDTRKTLGHFTKYIWRIEA